MYNAPNYNQINLIKAELSKIFRASEKLSFEEIGFKEGENHHYRNCDITVSDIIKILFGKVSSCQKNGIGTIISELSMEESIKKDYSRGSVFYRTEQIDPALFLSSLLDLIKPEPSNDYIKCTFDGSSVSLPKNKEIEAKYKKIKCNKNKYTLAPMAKLHYL